MARISTYAIDGTLASSDKLIGTDSSGTITKNYPLGSVSDWLKESGASAVLGQNNYTFQITADPDTGRLPGTISFDNYGGDGTAFSNITTFRLSKISSTGKNVANYLLSTVGDKVILGQLDDLNNFGVYTLVSLTQNSSETGFYDAALLFVEGNGALVGNGIYGLATHSASESAVWGNIEGTVTNQTDLVNYIDAEIAAIPAPATPTLQTVTDEGNTTNNPISTGTITANNELHFVNSAMRIFRSDNDMRLRTNNSDRVAITSAGNVGIGTTAPVHALHINKDNPYIQIQDSSASSRAQMNSGIIMKDSTGAQSFGITHSSTADVNIRANAGDLSLGTFAGTVIKLDGDNVGIGTTGPTEKLDVAGNIKLRGTNNLTIGSTSSGGNFSLSSGIRGYNFSNNNGDLLRIDSAGKVGIGTTSPGAKLHISRSDNGELLRLQDASNANQNYVFETEAVGTFYGLNIKNNSTGLSLLNIGADQKIGIATNNPLSSLHVNKQAANTHQILVGTNSSGLGIGHDSSGQQRSIIGSAYGNAASMISFTLGGYTTASDKMTILGSGNVGIGTTTPSAKLHIATSTTGGAASAILQDNNRTGTGTLNYLALVDSAAATQAKIGYLSTLNGELSFSNLIGSTTVSSTGQTTISAATNVLFNTSGSAKLKITNTGNVGIGTTSPTKKLHVNGDAFFQNTVSLPDNAYIGLGTGFDFHLLHNGSSSSITNSTGNLNILSNGGDAVFSTASTERLRITSTGNVGIGTTSPETKLSVAGGKIQLENYQEITWSDIGDGNTGRVSIRGSEDDDFILFRTDNAERMRIHTNGNVGIGTTSPGVPLDVTGVIRTTTSFVGNASIVNQVTAATSSGSIKFKNHSGVDRAIITDAGNVGIGTTSPSQKLEVAGNVIINDSGSGKVYLGDTNNYLGIISSNLYSVSSGQTIFYTNSAERMRITTAGNVGIGTTSPGSKLAVAGRVDFQNDLRLRGTDSAANQGVTRFFVDSSNKLHIDTANDGNNLFVIDSSGNVGIGTTSPGKTLDIAGEIRTSGRATFNEYVNTSLVYGNIDLNLGYAGGTSGIFIKGSGALAGNVGIGTTSPSYKLDISTTNGTSPLRLEDTSTSYKSFSVDYSSAFITTLKFGLLGRLSYDGNGGVMNIINASSQSGTSSTRFIMGGNEKMRITNTGNVGIGTTSPSGHLHVIDSGNLSSGGVYIQNTSTTSATLRLENTQGSSRLFTNNGITTLRNTRSGFSDYSVNIGAYGVKIKEGNGGLNSHASAILDLDSTTQGVLFPRMTELQKDSISSPATGLIIYQTDAQEGLYIYKSSGWTQII